MELYRTMPAKCTGEYLRPLLRGFAVLDRDLAAVEGYRKLNLISVVDLAK